MKIKEALVLFLQVTFVVLGFVTMIVVQLIENYTTGATAVTGTGVRSHISISIMCQQSGSSE